MEKERDGDRKKNVFFFLDLLFLFLDITVNRNRKARRANKALSIYIVENNSYTSDLFTVKAI
jgi:hypothetical protein